MFITVFTPTYNRAYILYNLYKSLIKQNTYNFEWIVIDDGSTDNTRSVVEQWIKEKPPFRIVYEKTSNGGKHRAHNRALKLAKGDAFITIDSDDYMADGTISFINSKFPFVMEDNGLAGMAGLRSYYSTGDIIGDVPKFAEFVDASNLEREEYGLNGDKTEIFKTEILKQYPFPEFDKEIFLTEAVSWNRIALDGYKIRWYNRTVCYCEYLNDGLTKHSDELFAKNPRGWAEYIKLEKRCMKTDNFILSAINFFDRLENQYEQTALQEMLELTSVETEQLIEIRNSVLRELIETVQDKSVALYGIGHNGKQLLKYLEHIDKKIEYCIDKNKNNTSIKWKQYSLEDVMNNVDIMFLTTKKLTQAEQEILLRKLPNTRFIKLWEKWPQIWR